MTCRCPRHLDSPLPPPLFLPHPTFNLPCFLASTPLLSGALASDNSLDGIYLNVVSLWITGGGFVSFATTFSITSGFIDGENTLSFHVANHDAAGGPTGFRATISGTAQAIPLPPAAWMGLAMLGGLGIVARLRKRKQALALV